MSLNELNDSTEDFSRANSSLTSSTSKDGDTSTKSIEFLKGGFKEAAVQFNNSIEVSLILFNFLLLIWKLSFLVLLLITFLF